MDNNEDIVRFFDVLGVHIYIIIVHFTKPRNR